MSRMSRMVSEPNNPIRDHPCHPWLKHRRHPAFLQRSQSVPRTVPRSTFHDTGKTLHDHGKSLHDPRRSLCETYERLCETYGSLCVVTKSSRAR